MSYARKSGVRGAPSSRQGAAVARKKRSADVYPDPEPDDITDLLPSTHKDTIAAKLKKVQDSRPLKAFLGDDGRVVDEFGRSLEPEGETASTSRGKRKTQHTQKPVQKGAFDADGAYFDDSLVHLKGRDKQRMVFGGGEGKYSQQGERMRKLQEAREEFKAKRQAADELMKAEPTPSAPTPPPEPTEEELRDDIFPVPDEEWWDQRVLMTQSYTDVRDDLTPDPKQWRLKFSIITHFVEHPIPLQGPNTAAPMEPQPLILTKKERKKIRTQTRTSREQDKQEKIAKGLLPPPPPKVKISNLMKVMGKEAVQDPTTVERFIRTQVAERMGRHEARNQERKLDPDSKRRKVVGKMTREANDDPMTTIYRINRLHSSKAIWKITENAKQLHVSGFLVRCPGGTNMVLFEGGKKPTRKFGRLLLNRIDYELDEADEGRGNASAVWQGYSGDKIPKEFKSLEFNGEQKARKYLDTLGLGHYWDLTVSGKVTELSDGDDDDL